VLCSRVRTWLDPSHAWLWFRRWPYQHPRLSYTVAHCEDYWQRDVVKYGQGQALDVTNNNIDSRNLGLIFFLDDTAGCGFLTSILHDRCELTAFRLSKTSSRVLYDWERDCFLYTNAVYLERKKRSRVSRILWRKITKASLQTPPEFCPPWREVNEVQMDDLTYSDLNTRVVLLPV
jgi:hypothetical protein